MSAHCVESAVARIAQACLEAPLCESPWQHVARALADEFPGMSVVVALAPGWSPMGPSYAVGIAESGLRRAVENAHRGNPWARYSRHYPEGHFGSGFEFFSPAELRRTAFYNEWMRPEGLGSGVVYGGFPVLREGVDELLVTVVGQRGARAPEPERERIGARAMPYLKRTFLLLERLSAVSGGGGDGGSPGAQGAPAWSEQVLDRLRIGAIVASSAARIEYRNHAAERVLRRGEPLRCRGARLMTADALETRRLHELIARAASNVAARGGALALRGGDDTRGVQLLVTPLPGRGMVPERALLLLLPGLPAPHGPADLLRKTWGLSRAEALLTARLAATFSLRDAAALQGLTYESARTYFKRSAEKLGVRTQAEAIDLVRRLAIVDPA